jgi:CheY-like chemotaxis protein
MRELDPGDGTDMPKGDILVVDDEPAELRALGRMLEDQGYEVRLVPNGRLALRAVEASTPDLILLDISMPEMDGYETCEQLKADERFANVPVIFLSGLADIEDKLKAFDAGGVRCGSMLRADGFGSRSRTRVRASLRSTVTRSSRSSVGWT